MQLQSIKSRLPPRVPANMNSPLFDSRPANDNAEGSASAPANDNARSPLELPQRSYTQPEEAPGKTPDTPQILAQMQADRAREMMETQEQFTGASAIPGEEPREESREMSRRQPSGDEEETPTEETSEEEDFEQDEEMRQAEELAALQAEAAEAERAQRVGAAIIAQAQKDADEHREKKNQLAWSVAEKTMGASWMVGGGIPYLIASNIRVLNAVSIKNKNIPKPSILKYLVTLWANFVGILTFVATFPCVLMALIFIATVVGGLVALSAIFG